MKTISSSGSFKDFTNDNFIYIDKTKTIYNLLKTKKRVFISRPRRFGKSLTLDTIGTLFEKGVEPYFKGTWIYDKWDESTYPVLRLSFLRYSVSDVEEFKRRLVKDISNFAKHNNVKNYEEDPTPDGSIDSLLESLKDEQRHMVILIDEYDCQLTANINNTELYDSFREVIRSFYGCIKDKEAVKFMFVTGVTRLKDVSIFSVGSDISDITNASVYSQMIGFTRDEIKKFYIDYLKLAASYENNISVEDVTDDEVETILNKLAENYDGYCFDEFYKKKVFSTWSVNSFFQNLAANGFIHYGEYWYDNGGLPSILVNYLKTHELNIFDYLEKDKLISVATDDFKNPTSLTTINQNVLMCQTGYLTLHSNLKYKEMLLGIPNGEIYKALTSLMAAKFFEGNFKVFNDRGVNALEEGTSEDIVSLLNTIVNSVTYDNFPISSESMVQNLVQAYLRGAGFDVRTEVHESKGRADLIVELTNRRIVFEFKYSENEIEAKTKLTEAIEQIKTRDYGNTLPKKDELLRIAAVFNADPKVRAFTAYKSV